MVKPLVQHCERVVANIYGAMTAVWDRAIRLIETLVTMLQYRLNYRT